MDEYGRKVLQTLVDTILDNTRLNRNGKLEFSYDADDEILLVIKTFFADEYHGRLATLKLEEEEE